MRSTRLLAIGSALALTAVAAFALVQGGRADRNEVARLVEILDIDPGDVVGDVGAGDGKWTTALSREVGESGRIYATEVSKLDRLRGRIANEKLDNVEVVVGSQTETGLPDDCCDAVLLRRVYHHFQDPESMQSSLRGALKSDGLLLVVEFDTKTRWKRPDGIPESRDGHGIDEPMLIEEMRQSGFEVAERMKWPNGDYAVLFRLSGTE